MQVLKITSSLVSFYSRTTTISHLLHMHIKIPTVMIHKPSVISPSMRRGLWLVSLMSLAILGYLAFEFSGVEASLKYRVLPCVIRCYSGLCEIDL